MSEQKSAETATETAQPNKQEPDDSEPSPERQAELRAAYEANVKLGKPPYAGVVIRTRGELNWIVQERGWRTGAYDSVEQMIDLRNTGIRGAALNHADLNYANLSGAVIASANLSNAVLLYANLSSANIANTNLSNAELGLANLSGANIVGVNLSNADLTLANLSGAGIADTDFSDADLTGVNLSGAAISAVDSNTNFRDTDLTGANLSGALIFGNFSGADLTQARMDSSTLLGGSDARDASDTFQLDAESHLLDVSWNGAILANVRWERVPRLGDEADIKAAQTRAERVAAIRNAARAYRGLAKALQAQGLTIPALKYRRREQQLERRALLYSFALGPWLFSWLLNIVSGYGDKPARALACYLAVVGSFSGAYWAITNQVFSFITSSSAHLAWYEALVLSISSFHGRGFFPSIPSLGDPIAIVAAAEAIIGLFIELVFIATFTQRFFAR